MNQAQTAINYLKGLGTQIEENPILQVLFFRLCCLLTLPVIPIFVFDGPDRPVEKQGIRVEKQPHWLTERFEAFIEAFGFCWYTVTDLPSILFLLIN
jgi:holliday junction resolvase YEN1